TTADPPRRPSMARSSTLRPTPAGSGLSATPNWCFRMAWADRLHRICAGDPGLRHDGASGAWLPAEEPQREQQGADAPGTDDEHVAPVERRAQEAGLYPVGEMLDREDASNPGDPRRSVVTDRDEDARQEQQRQNRRVDYRRGRVGVGDHRGDGEPEGAQAG